jgi:hypothetical protein
MGIYQRQNLGTNISTIVSFDDSQDESMRSYERGSTEPTITPTGLLWDCTDSTLLTSLGLSGVSEAMLRWDGSDWTVHAIVGTPALAANGKVALTANLPAGGYKVTGLAAGSANGDSVRYEQVLLLAGGTMAGNIAMVGNRVTGLGAPSSANDAARKTDVDGKVSNQFYQTTGTGAARIDSGPLYGDPDVNWVERMKTTTFPAERARLVLKGQLVENSSGTAISDNFHAVLDIPRVRVPGSSDNGGLVRFPVGWISNSGSGTWTVLQAAFDDAYVSGSTPTAYDGATDGFLLNDAVTVVVIRWKWFTDPVGSNTTGFAFWCVRTSDGAFLSLDEVGGATDEGVLQLWLS